MATKYYAVKNGLVPGIYNSWPECEAQVKGFSGAKYKSFSSMEDALEFMGETVNKIDNYSDYIKVYCDGSYNKNNNSYGYATVIYEDNIELTRLSGSSTCIYGGNNIEGEIAAITKALEYILNNCDNNKIVVYYDYAGIELWANKKQSANKKYTRNYVNFIDMCRNLSNLIIEFVHIKSHTNNTGNELVDKLAKQACGI